MSVIKLETSGPNILRGIHTSLEVFSEQVEEYCEEVNEHEEAPQDMVESLNCLVANLANHLEMDFSGYQMSYGDISAGGILRQTNQLAALLEGSLGLNTKE